VDGFNLFHAIDDFQTPHLKWLNLVALANRVIPTKSEYVARIVQCTAIPKPKGANDREGIAREELHRQYVRALELVGVECLKGHFMTDSIECRNCGHEWPKPSEKQGDVNLAISLIDDAHQNLFDHAYLVTNDTDQVATIALFVKRFIRTGAAKKLTIVNPPQHPKKHRTQYRHTRSMNNYFEQFQNDANLRQITVDDIHYSLFPTIAQIGLESVRRPQHYDPPTNWNINPAAVLHVSSFLPKPIVAAPV
jgi:hypothetical protein